MVSRWRRVLSQWCRGGVPVVSRRCNGPVPVVSRWCCSDVPVVFLWCLGVAVLVRSCPVCGWCPSGILVVSRRCPGVLVVSRCSCLRPFSENLRFGAVDAPVYFCLGVPAVVSRWCPAVFRWCPGVAVVSRSCVGGVPVVLRCMVQSCPGGVPVVSQWCSGGVAAVSSGVPVASRWCRGGVPVSQWCPSGAGVPSYLGACPDSVPAVFHPVVWCRDWLVFRW